jgi:ribosomal protein L11 methylase PrmA
VVRSSARADAAVPPLAGAVERRAERDPGSFRDPAGAVHHLDGRVLRVFRDEAGAERFRAVQASGLLERLVASRALVATRVVDDAAVRSEFPDAALVVEHERIPFISYPYEWPFELLRSAALQYLETLRAALDHGFLVKDATAYNTQFRGVAPTLIDVASFEPYVADQPWYSYSQFCSMFLAPLMLQGLAGLPFQAWLRSSLGGIEVDRLGRLLRWRHKLRRDVLLHVVLQSWLNSRGESGAPAAGASRPSVPRATIYRLAAKLERSVSGLSRDGARRSHWLEYEVDCHYAPGAVSAKVAFVRDALAAARPRCTWDLGCNTGRYSLLAAEYSEHVVAMDADEQAVGRLAQRLGSGPLNVLPLVMDLLNPSPDQGWGQRERAGLSGRGPADFALALALTHHLAIGGSVPLAEIARWLAQHARAGVVEFVPQQDPMAQRLLATRPDASPYDEGSFRAALEAHCRVTGVLRLPESERVLYAFTARQP